MLTGILAFGFVAGLYIGLVAGRRYAELATAPRAPQQRLERRGEARTAQPDDIHVRAIQTLWGLNKRDAQQAIARAHSAGCTTLDEIVAHNAKR